MVWRGSTDDKEEQDMAISVDNICYDKLTSKLHPESKVYVQTLNNVCKQKCSINYIINGHTHSLSTNHCGLPAGGAVFGGRAGFLDGEDYWQTHPNCHLVLQWEEGGG